MGVMRMIYHTLVYWEIGRMDKVKELELINHTDSMLMISKFKLVEQYGNSWYTNMHSIAHANVLLQLWDAMKDIKPFKIVPMYIQTHQDREKQFEFLDPNAQMNVLCNKLATEALEEMAKANKIQQVKPLPACRAYLNIDGELMSANEKQRLREGI